MNTPSPSQFDVGLDLAEHAQLVAGILERLVNRFDDEAVYEHTRPAGALALYELSRLLTGLARDLASETDRLLIASLDGQHKAIIGDKLVEVRRAYKRTWDTPLLAGAVAATVLEGERIPEVDTVVEALVKVARLDWRVTALTDLGIDSDDYCRKELGRATVSVSA